MDFDASIITRKFKENKFLLPAVIVGGLVGGYFLLKSGSNSPNAAGNTSETLDPPVDGGSSGLGGGGSTQSSDLGSIADSLTQQVTDFISGQSDTLASFQSQLDESFTTNSSFYEQATGYINDAISGIDQQVSDIGDFANTYPMESISQPMQQPQTYTPVDFSMIIPQALISNDAMKTGVFNDPAIASGSKSVSASFSGVRPQANITRFTGSKSVAPIKTVKPIVKTSAVPSFGISAKYGFQTVRNRISNALVKPVSKAVIKPKKTVKK